MLKRQTVSVSVAARGSPASGFRRSAAGSGAPGRGGSRSPLNRRRPAGAPGRRGSEAGSGWSSRSRCPRVSPRCSRSADRRSRLREACSTCRSCPCRPFRSAARPPASDRSVRAVPARRGRQRRLRLPPRGSKTAVRLAFGGSVGRAWFQSRHAYLIIVLGDESNHLIAIHLDCDLICCRLLGRRIFADAPCHSSLSLRRSSGDESVGLHGQSAWLNYACVACG